MRSVIKPAIILLVGLVTALPAAHAAEPAKAASLDQLLEKVRRGWRVEQKAEKQREADFLAAKNQQKALLAKARADVVAAEKRSTMLEKTFQGNETRIAELEDTLRRTLGNMGELFGVVRQVAGDTRGQLESSLVSSQFPKRVDKLTPLLTSKTTPSIAALEGLWWVLQHEMTESG